MIALFSVLSVCESVQVITKEFRLVSEVLCYNFVVTLEPLQLGTLVCVLHLCNVQVKLEHQGQGVKVKVEQAKYHVICPVCGCI